AALRASSTRAPGGSVYIPGCRAAPATWTRIPAAGGAGTDAGAPPGAVGRATGVDAEAGGDCAGAFVAGGCAIIRSKSGLFWAVAAGGRRSARKALTLTGATPSAVAAPPIATTRRSCVSISVPPWRFRAHRQFSRARGRFLPEIGGKQDPA